MITNLHTFPQKYVLRPIHRLTHDYRLPTIIGGATLLPAAITLIVLHPRVDNAPLFITQLALLLLGIGGLPTVFMVEEAYKGEYDHKRNLKLAKRLATMLTTTGRIPSEVLQQHYNRRHILKLPVDVDKLIFTEGTQHLFDYHYSKGVAAREQVASELDIPYPDGGDYQNAYYKTYARLRAIREHPELATVQDSLIDDLYGVG